MQAFTFDNMFTLADTYDETELYYFIGNRKVPSMYSNNKIVLDFVPTAEELDILEDNFLDYAYDLNLAYYSFVLPMNQPLAPDLFASIGEVGYEISLTKLMVLDPADFKATTKAKDTYGDRLVLKEVNPSIEQDYIDFNQVFDKAIDDSGQFAAQKLNYYPWFLAENYTTALAVYIDDKLVAITDIIRLANAYEIDNFQVLDDYQRQGIGSLIQQWVCDKALAEGKMIILSADADDTPYDMYVKQGYQDQGMQIGLNRKIEAPIIEDIQTYQADPVAYMLENAAFDDFDEFEAFEDE
ncbi:GNAT family N-acetyltransferase [Carnobacterium sp. PL12RED10]|uniref:GNAT family N-acetyltransferase n=1 Tax=Carnobacterium sp. PL12RED10 TaxID=2592351 RepID=UPI0011EBD5B3|nr:GNAT family N-acetyltransferase [Carnobacterium sp. PL12RED10]KAF3301788.1 GNAT family N-acetyltransferase [Carnobacterium sp. PL12RED10]KAF3301944.1 GNAT family N-acetyltransferase [Carnobacterium sp. PL17RED31]